MFTNFYLKNFDEFFNLKNFEGPPLVCAFSLQKNLGHGPPMLVYVNFCNRYFIITIDLDPPNFYASRTPCLVPTDYKQWQQITSPVS